MANSLLRTKLYRPPARPDLVPRQRLLDRLSTNLWSTQDTVWASFARRLTLISAPAGFGKTTLITEWLSSLEAAAAEPEPNALSLKSCWLSLDDADNDAVRFLTYLIAALQTASPDIGLEAQVVLQARAQPALDSALLLLINDLAATSVPLILVLDDCHIIHNEAVDSLVSELLERQPPNFHLVITSRADPVLQLSRLRGRGQMLELRARDLRFTEDEAAAFLNRTMKANVTAEMIAVLAARTEGWIAGLQLAALSLQGRDDADAFVRTFSGNNHYIIDYLVDDVLRHQTPEVRDFLVQTAILERLSAPLCDAVTDTGKSANGQITRREALPPLDASTVPYATSFPNSRTILDYLEHANLFLIPLDDQRKWYRYHYLFADSLKAELGPAQLSILHRRAALWHDAAGLLPQAVRHALAAPDFALAAELLGGAGREASLWAGGDFHGYCTWVEKLPEEVRRAHPRLQLVYARALQITGQVARAEEVLTTVDLALQATPEADGELAALAAMYRAHCLLERGVLSRGLELANYAMNHIPASARVDHARAVACLACIEYGLGDFGVAGELFDQASRTPESQSLSLNSAECGARCQVLQGNLGAAQLMCEQLIAANRIGTTYHHMVAGVFAAQGEIAYHRNHLEHIEAACEQAIELAQLLAPQALSRAHQSWSYLQLARLRQVQGREADAAQFIAQADQVAREIGNDFYLNFARLRQRSFQIGREYGIPALLRVRTYPPVAFGFLQEYAKWTEALSLSAQNQPQEALAILDELLTVAQHDSRRLSIIELQLWRALTLQTLGKPNLALAAVKQAVALAAPEECLRLFLDVGPGLTGLLRQAQAAAPDFVSRLLTGFGDADTGSVAAVHPLPVRKPVASSKAPLSMQLETLGEREIEILRLLADGLPNREIGDQLFIGVGTVKWYLTNLYRKLDVGNRTQAVARARELGIVE